MKHVGLHRPIFKNLHITKIYYGKYSIIISAIEFWNKGQDYLENTSICHLSPNNITLLVSDKHLKKN